MQHARYSGARDVRAVWFINNATGNTINRFCATMKMRCLGLLLNSPASMAAADIAVFRRCCNEPDGNSASTAWRIWCRKFPPQ